MAQIWITGDIHGNARRFSMDVFPEQKEFIDGKDNNFMIILGDFGLIWDWHGETKEEKYWLDWLENKDYTTVFVDGNHENFDRLYQYPVKEWRGGKVHEIRPHVLHLMRGEYFEINGKTFFTFGGASSHDIQDGIIDPDDYVDEQDFRDACREKDRFGEYMYRIKGRSWWKQELPTEEEIQHGLDMLATHGNKADFMITHSPSASEIALIGQGLYEQDGLTKYLEKIKQENDIGMHFSGHLHINRQISQKEIILYEQIIRIA